MKKIILTILTVLLLICMTLILIINANAIKKFYSKKQQYKGTIRLSQGEKDIYNAKIKPYVKDGVKGSDVKSMLDEIIAKNQNNVGKKGQFIGIRTENIYDYENEIEEICKKASIYDSKTGAVVNYNEKETINNEESVVEATKEIKKLKSKIESNKKYNITVVMNEGIYTWITISELEKNEKVKK